MPALARVEGEPVGIRAGAREQRGQRDHQREQGLVEGPEAPGDPLLDVPGVVATLDAVMGVGGVPPSSLAADIVLQVARGGPGKSLTTR